MQRDDGRVISNFIYVRLYLAREVFAHKLNILINKSKNLGVARIPLSTSAENLENLNKDIAIIGGIKNKDVNWSIELAKAIHEDNKLLLLAPDYIDANISVNIVNII